MQLRRPRVLATALTGAVLAALAMTIPAGTADGYVPISGAGSTWAQNALDQWRRDLSPIGLQVNYQGTGSADGRNQFQNGTVDFALTDLPYLDAEAAAATRPYAYAPLVGGGIGVGYKLEIAGTAVSDLRLSRATLARIFTGEITSWDDPTIQSENTGRVLPALPITRVVRADAAGVTYAYTSFLSLYDPEGWQACTGGQTGPRTLFPAGCGAEGTVVTQTGALGVAGYLSQGAAPNGLIAFGENAYWMNTRQPVALLRNAAGFYVGPQGYGPTVALRQAGTNPDGSADLGPVFAATDPRAYPVSFYSYGVVPSALGGSMTTAKRTSLARFLAHAVCDGSGVSLALGYSPLPLNLVQQTFAAVQALKTADPATEVTDLDPAHCDNPTFDKTDLDADRLGQIAPMPTPVHVTGVPTIAGTARIGATVSTTRGSWVNQGYFRYAWTADGVRVGYTSAPSFTVPARAGGTRLRVTVIAFAADGKDSARLTSAPVRVPLGTQTMTSLRISGRPVVGQRLTALVVANPAATRRYQWYAGGRPIRGATRATLRLYPAERGLRIRVRVTLVRVGYAPLSRLSAPTSVVRARS